MDGRTAIGAAAPTRLFLAVLVLVTSLGPFAMQIFIPALPAIQDDFGSSPAVTQLALSLSMVAIAVFTLFYGPLSDAYGRRPVLMVGIGTYLAGSALCAVAPDVGWLIVGRVLQAAGGASGIVLSRAIVRDLYPTDRVASVIAYLTVAMVVSPMIAPVVGGVAIDLVGWRTNFVFVGALGALVMLGALAALSETNVRRTPIRSAADFVGGFGRLLRSLRFCGYVFQGSFSAAIFFSFLAGAPYVMIDVLHRPATEYGIWFFFLALAFMLGNLIAARTSRRLGIDRSILWASGAAFALAVLYFVLVHSLPWSPALLFGPAILIGCTQGFTMPNGQAAVVSHDPDMAGTAAGLSGFLQMGIAALFAQWVGTIQDGTPYPTVLMMTAAAGLSFLAILIGVRAGRRERRDAI